MLHWVLVLGGCASRGVVDSAMPVPEGIRVAVAQGVAALYRRDYADAVRRFEAVLQLDPANREARLRLGDVAFRTGDYAGAMRAYGTVLESSPEDPLARSGLWAARLQAAGYNDDAKAAVREEVDGLAKGRSTAARWAAYRGYDLLHDNTAARKMLLALLSARLPDDARDELATDAFEAALGEGDARERRRLVDAFLAVFPESVYRHLLYHYQLSWTARTQGAAGFRREARRLLRRDPDNRALNFASGYWSIDFEIDLPWAVERVRTALRLIEHPDVRQKLPYVTIDRWRTMLRETRGRYEGVLGWGLFLLGRREEAEAAFQRAASLLPRDPRIAYYRGRWLEAAGRDREAFDAYRVAVETDSSVDVRIALDRAARAAGVLDGETQELRTVLARREGITTFTDVTDAAGLGGVTGGRVAWGDYDGDGAEDLLIDGRRLFRNVGGARFEEVTDRAGLGENPGGNGGVWADFDNDGRLDLFTTGTGQPDVSGSAGRLWVNRGDGTFRSGDELLPSGLTVSAPTEGAGWGDYDRDDFVDLYLANYERPLDRAVGLGICTPDHLLRNVGGRRLEDVTASAGLTSAEPMCGRGVAWADYDGDGLPDIAVTNYRLDPNFLWRNLGDGTFRNVAREAGVEGTEQEGAFGHSIGAEWADVNRDGVLDLFIANLAHPRYIGYSDPSQLLVSRGVPAVSFVDRYEDSGFVFDETASDPSWGDFDNDGDLDLYVTSVYRGRRSTLYRNDGSGHFSDVTWLAGAGVENGWGGAYADIDSDGDLDLVVGSGDGIRLLRNDGNANHWLHVRPVGTKSNRSAIGARVTVVAGGLRQIAEVQGGKGTGNQHSLAVEFGLGGWDQTVRVEVRFPSGRLWKGRVKPDRVLTVKEPHS